MWLKVQYCPRMTDTHTPQRDSRQTLPLLFIFISLLGGFSLGQSPVLAAAAIVLCAAGFFIHVLTSARIERAAALAVAFIVYNAFSGVVFGGFAAIGETSLLDWIANEGRVFLYYWPALYVMQVFKPSSAGITLRRFLQLLTVLAFCIMLVKTATGFSTFSTHHAAGAFIAGLVFYNLFRFDETRSVADLSYLLLAVIALLASNSRTSLLAVVITITLVYLSSARILRVLRTAVLLIPLAIAMPFLFPTEFSRLADAATTETLQSMRINVVEAFSSRNPIEVSTAFNLTKSIDIDGNANLVIRSYLWGRTLGEGIRSPIFGEGFGRVNDMGRIYRGTPYLFYPATEAHYPNPSDLTAHNSYLQVFAELGLIGLTLILITYRLIWMGLKGDRLWSMVGRSSLICLLLMSTTQHAFGAPIYGLSLFLLAAVANRMCRARRAQDQLLSCETSTLPKQTHSQGAAKYRLD